MQTQSDPVWYPVLSVGVPVGFFGAEIGGRPTVQFPSRASNPLRFVFAIFLPNYQHRFNSQPSPTQMMAVVFHIVLGPRLEATSTWHFIPF